MAHGMLDKNCDSTTSPVTVAAKNIKEAVLREERIRAFLWAEPGLGDTVDIMGIIRAENFKSRQFIGKAT